MKGELNKVVRTHLFLFFSPFIGPALPPGFSRSDKETELAVPLKLNVQVSRIYKAIPSSFKKKCSQFSFTLPSQVQNVISVIFLRYFAATE